MTIQDKKSLANLIGATIVTTLSATAVNAAENPFQIKDLPAGYLAVATEGGEVVGTPPAAPKAKEGACGEGKCGAEMMKQPEMKCGAGMKDMQKKPDAAAEKKAMEGKCAGMKMDAAPKSP